MKSAFTFIESLLVLICLALVLIIAQPAKFQDLQEDIQSRHFFQTLISQLKYSKEKAILENSPTLVHFDGPGQVVLFNQGNKDQDYLVLEIPEVWSLASDYQLIYYGDGRANSFRTIQFNHRYKNKEVRLYFQLGSGIFDQVLYWEDI